MELFPAENITDPEIRSAEVPEERENVTDADIALHMSKKEAKEGDGGLGGFAGGEVGGRAQRTGKSRVVNAQASSAISVGVQISIRIIASFFVPTIRLTAWNENTVLVSNVLIYHHAIMSFDHSHHFFVICFYKAV